MVVPIEKKLLNSIVLNAKHVKAYSVKRKASIHVMQSINSCTQAHCSHDDCVKIRLLNFYQTNLIC